MDGGGGTNYRLSQRPCPLCSHAFISIIVCISRPQNLSLQLLNSVRQLLLAGQENILFSIFNAPHPLLLSFSHIPLLYMNCPNYVCLSFAAVHEFPTDLFTNKEKAEGAVALHVLCVSLVPPLFYRSDLMFMQITDVF